MTSRGVIENEMDRELEWAASRPTSRSGENKPTLETPDCWELCTAIVGRDKGSS